MSIEATTNTLGAITAPTQRPKAQSPMFLPGGDNNQGTTPDLAPTRRDFTSAMQAMLLQAQESAAR